MVGWGKKEVGPTPHFRFIGKTFRWLDPHVGLKGNRHYEPVIPELTHGVFASLMSTNLVSTVSEKAGQVSTMVALNF